LRPSTTAEVWGITADFASPRHVLVQVLDVLGQGVDRVVLRERRLPWTEQLDLMEHLLTKGADPSRVLLRVGDPGQLADARLLGCGVHLSDRRWTRRPPLPFVSRAIHRHRDVQDVVADAIVVSPIAQPRSKPPTHPSLGIEGLRQLVMAARVPVIALGGIRPGLAADCIRAGASGVAAITAVFGGIAGELDALQQAVRMSTKLG